MDLATIVSARWNLRRWPRLMGIWIMAGLAVLNAPLQAGLAKGKRGIIATGHPLATEAGLQAFRKGGNAIDAAVAAALMLGVVDGHNSGIGGGCLMLIRLANGKIVAIDGREMAPGAAHRDLYRREGRVISGLSKVGPLAIGVPGALMAYSYAATAYGRLSLREPLLAGAQVAEQGFRINQSYAEALRGAAPELRLFEASRALFFRPDGMVWEEGQVLVQRDLAQTYRAIAAHGIGWFYYGAFAVAAGDWIVRHGGILTAFDLANYQIKLRDPVVTEYRGHTLIGFPPPSSGGVHVAQILNTLEHFDLKKNQTNRLESIHLIAEAMKLAFADRAHWLGDADFVHVPRGLISKSYAAELAQKIKAREPLADVQPGKPKQAATDVFGKHTTHFSAADALGNWVACTATVNTSFGSKVVIPGSGVIMNNEMDDFSIHPGVPNYFGLVGSEANAIAPRKRPLSSMSPTLVLKNGQPILSLGAAGGPTIISQVVLALIHLLDYGMDLDTALNQARFHHQWMPDELLVEAKLEAGLTQELEEGGRKVVTRKTIGSTQVIQLDLKEKVFIGMNDPRNDGSAAGF